MKLAVAMNKPRKQWLGVLAHEYSHYEQWKEQAESWTNSTIDEEDAEDIIFRWVRGEEFSQNFLDKCFIAAKEIELDCERRAVKKIKKFELPLDVEEYIKQASAYIHYYNYMGLRRNSYIPGKEPYYNKEIISAMPKTLRGKYAKLPKKIIQLYDNLLLK